MNRIRSRSRGSRRDTTISGADSIPPRRPGTEAVPRAEVRRRRSINGEDSISLSDILQERAAVDVAPAVRVAIQRSEEIQAMAMLIAGVDGANEDQAERVKFDQRDYDEILGRERPQQEQQRRRQHVRGQQPTRTQPSRRQQPARGNGKQQAAATSSSSPLSSSEQDEEDEATEQVVRPDRPTVRAGKLPTVKRKCKRNEPVSGASNGDGDDEDEVAVKAKDKEESNDEVAGEVNDRSRSAVRAGKLPVIQKRGIKRKRNEHVSEAKVEDQEGSEQVNEAAGEVEDRSRAAIRAGELPVTQKRGIKRTCNQAPVNVEDEDEDEDEVESDRSAADNNDDNADEPQVFCFCREEEHGYMISCDGCHEWFHEACINVSMERAQRLVADKIAWYCRRCNPVPYRAPSPLVPVTRGEVWRAIPPGGILISELVGMFFERIDKTQGPDGWITIVGAVIRKASDVPHVGEAGEMRIVRRQKRTHATNDQPGPSTRTGGTPGNSQV